MKIEKVAPEYKKLLKEQKKSLNEGNLVRDYDPKFKNKHIKFEDIEKLGPKITNSSLNFEAETSCPPTPYYS